MKNFLLFILFIFVIEANDSLSQTVTGNIEGYVLDPSGGELSGVNIVLSSEDAGQHRGTATNDRGYFILSALPVGLYDIQLKYLGYQEIILKNVRVHLGKTTTLGIIEMKDKILEAPEIVVYGERPLIDITKTSVGENITARDYEALPIKRDYRSIVALLPHANTSYYGDGTNIGGSTGYESFYFIDGNNSTDPQKGASSINLPYNFIREIEYVEGGYEAEYGKALGGLVNVITYSGNNTFSANAFAYWTGSALTGEEKIGYAETEVKKYTKYDFGISIGGPILRDNLWYFVAYNPTFEINDIEIGQFGIHQDKKTMHRFAGKLNWQVSDKTSMILSIMGDPTEHEKIGPRVGYQIPQTLQNPDPVLGFFKQGGISGSLLARSSLSSILLLEGGVSYLVHQGDNYGNTNVARNQPLFNDYSLLPLQPMTVSGGFGHRQELYDSRISGWLQGTILMNQHVIKAGIGYEDNFSNNKIESTAPGVINNITENYYRGIYWLSSGKVHNRIPSVYIQDSWQVNKYLRLNLGLRWEAQYLINSDGSLGQAFPYQWQPRIGIVFLPGASTANKIFGSFGRYYQQFGTFYPLLRGSMWQQEIRFWSVDPRIYPEAMDSVWVAHDSNAPFDLINTKGLESEYHDQFILGYQRLLSAHLKIGITGIYKVLRNAFLSGTNDEGKLVLGNPGSGDMDFLDPVRREYTALELSISRMGAPGLNFLASYVLSQSYGNYGGQFNQDNATGFPGDYSSYKCREQVPNSTGLLPNDRTHAIKIYGAYALEFGLTGGIFFTWQSGAPLSKFGQHPSPFARQIFLVQRGSAGRMPDLWDLNLRLSYLLDVNYFGRVKPRLVLDFFHIGNPRKAVNFDQWIYYLDSSYNEVPNPQYGEALAYQPPFAVRLGLDVRF